VNDVVVTNELTKLYRNGKGVTGLSFSIPQGEVFGYLGPNGSGKTTTIRTLLDLIRPTGGRAKVFGLDTHRQSREIHRRTGYLPGELNLYDRLTGEQMLLYLANLRGGVDPAHMRELSERLSCDLHERIRSLSHGNRQKLGVIQAFMHRPDLLILDEPTQGLDPLVQQEFHRLISEARNTGATVFLSSHVLPEVERMCDRVGIIRDGRLITVEDVGVMKTRAVREIEIHFARPVAADAFAGLPGVGAVHMQGDVLRCKVTGPVDGLIKAAARHEVVGISTAEASLEEIFLRFYGRTDDA